MKRYTTIIVLLAVIGAGLLVLGVTNLALAHGGGPGDRAGTSTPVWGSMMGNPPVEQQDGEYNVGPRNVNGYGQANGVWGYMQSAWRTMMGGWNAMMGGWGGMMGGMMGGWNGMMGNGWSGGGMMGAWSAGSGTPIDAEEAQRIAEDYVASYGNPDLEVAEIMEFDNQFYVQAREESTGRYAFEFLIDRYTGATHPEPGPNMMWNTRYGHMGGWGGMMGGGMMGGTWGTPDGEMTVSPEQAIEIAQAYLDQYAPGLKAADEADAFYGYYTLHTVKDGEVVGMLSVNGYTGQVWPHTWHGEYLGMVGGDEH